MAAPTEFPMTAYFCGPECPGLQHQHGVDACEEADPFGFWETSRNEKYANAMLQNACKRIQEAGDGLRHHTLANESFLVGGYLQFLPHPGALAALIAAGVACGMPKREAARVVAAELERGALKPRMAGMLPEIKFGFRSLADDEIHAVMHAIDTAAVRVGPAARGAILRRLRSELRALTWAGGMIE